MPGRLAAGMHFCICNHAGCVACPACCARILHQVAVERWGGDPEFEDVKHVPLVGTARDPTEFVSKVAVVDTIREDVLVLSHGIADVVPDDITGHFMCRGWAKALVRAGLSLVRIQCSGRFYIEEAIEEGRVCRQFAATWN